jgi:hypothetical protein
MMVIVPKMGYVPDEGYYNWRRVFYLMMVIVPGDGYYT